MVGEIWIYGEGIKAAIPGRRHNMSKYAEVQMNMI